MTDPVDPETLAELLHATGDDQAFLDELIDTYLAEAPSLLAAMRHAIASGDSAGLRRQAHTLKSSSAALGADRLADLCRRLEHGDGLPETLAAQAEDEYRRVRRSLEATRPRR